MKMALDGNTLMIKGADTVQFTVIKSWNKMKWSRADQMLRGTADLELLDKLSSIVKLPPQVEDRRQAFKRLAAAIDAERMNQEPVAAYPYPVKLPLYKHQIRAANMCMMVFGLIGPTETEANEDGQRKNDPRRNPAPDLIPKR